MSAIGLASSNPYTDDAAVVGEEARHAQDLGYVTLWRSGDLPMVAAAVRATTTIPVATGIISVSRVSAADVIALHADLDPGRFVAGIGGAHGPRPLQSITGYLDELDAAGIRPAGVLGAQARRLPPKPVAPGFHRNRYRSGERPAARWHHCLG
ncbi:MAG: hypothetical protein U5N53_04195 [Mycobacterium sp.]|nr:hypothetical protein [Mycobacterium sp.]